MFNRKTLHKTWCMNGWIVVWSYQSAVPHSCGLLNHLNSFRKGVFKLNAKSDSDSLSWWSCQSPVAHSCSLLNHLNSFCEGCSSLMQNLIQVCFSTHSVILNAMATQYTCSLKGVYHPHWLVQQSCHCSCMHIPVYSPWLPCYISYANHSCTTAGLFSDRPQCILVY